MYVFFDQVLTSYLLAPAVPPGGNPFSENALFEQKPTSYLLAPAVPPGGNSFSEKVLFGKENTSYLLAPAVPPGGNPFSEKVTFGNARRTADGGRRKNLQSQTQPQSPTHPGKKYPRSE